ncbi:hypothetical protein IW140_002480 [Coemansia sp. RSA 1813]|nr:hypothetical protein LPJ74_002859 [Coemansia sp. RSA 1843]KAJ2215950.1 hypothetical protein EV179_001778 [Coemansia sp. RSA 487]KAJ2570204.1 hypothetical protein IW140_002480 [Coemansia sp. RSA 1813]
MTVLSESDFTSRVDRIIERDFFPDLKRLQAQSKELDLTETDNIFSESNDQDNARQDKDVSLDQFLATHTSEDNASFGRLLESENARRKHVYERVVGNSNDRKLVASVGTKNGSHTKGGLETWKYTARNALMFVPGTHETTDERRVIHSGPRILAHNTRISEDMGVADDHSDWDAESAISINSSVTPVINGYKLIREPGSVRRGGTGVRKIRGFAIGETTPRERLALRLSTPPGIRRGTGKRESSRSGSSSGIAAQRSLMLSPAAQRLLHGSNKRGKGATQSVAQRNDDEELQRAYNSPYVRRDSPVRRRL